jgi:putative DNA methylase
MNLRTSNIVPTANATNSTSPKAPKPSKRAIEEDFPIVEINHLAAPERNAFKPIYQMHKWFARRASCVFRAILLGALKPVGTNLMEEFYKDHTNDPDTRGKVILDPFMGGGTTMVEALRLGCKVVGVDLNPVAWFIVKTEVEPVDLAELDAAFERLSNRIVPWSGKPLRQTLLDLYKTDAPWTAEEVCGLTQSDVIYTFWVKSAICTSPTCRKQVPLFSDYVVAAKSPSIRYYPDCECPKCKAVFDWEIEPAALIADPQLMLNSARNSNGKGSARWTYAHPDGGLFVAQGESDGTQAKVRWGVLERGHVCCPHCYEMVKVSAYMHDEKSRKKRKPQRKKVPLTVLLCPQTEDVFQWRGEIAADAMVTSPAGRVFNPQKAHVTEKGRFVCPHCGNNDSIISSIRSLPPEQLLPIHAYGLQAYAPGCDPTNDPAKTGGQAGDLFAAEEKTEQTETDEDEEIVADVSYTGPFVPRTQNLIWKQSGKFYARHSPRDQALYSSAKKHWSKNSGALPYPKSQIPSGQETDRLNDHHYRHWHHMFNERQLLGLSTLLEGIAAEKKLVCQEMLLSAFFSLLEGSNLFARYKTNQSKSESAKGIFSRHDFQPKTTPCEDHVWGVAYGKGFVPWFQIVRKGKQWGQNPEDCSYDLNGKLTRHYDGSSAEASDVYSDQICLEDRAANLRCGDSRTLSDAVLEKVDFVITDPPYADNVNYAELADFFYVWLRLVLKDRYAVFLPEHTPKLAEIVQNDKRGVSAEDFGKGLEAVFKISHTKLNDEGVMAFTFHHAEGSAWENLLSAVMNAGFEIEAIYPVQSEGESSLHLQDNDAIAYDLIHVCRKRRSEDTRTKRSWAGLRQIVRQRAKEEIARIESGRYGGQSLSPADMRIVLTGKCLEVYSRHYGVVLDWNGEPFPLKSALQDIRMMVAQIVSKETPLPSELESIDAISQVWLLGLCDKREVSVDSINKDARTIVEVGDLTGHKPPLLRKGRIKGGRTYEVLTPSERLDGLRVILRGVGANAQQLALLAEDDNAPIAFGPKLVDVVHLLAGNAEQGERLDHLVERFRGQREQIRAALQYLKQRDPDRWSKSSDKLLPFYDDMFAQQMISKK